MNYIEYIKEQHQKNMIGNSLCKQVMFEDINNKRFDGIENDLFKEVLKEFKDKGYFTRNYIFSEVRKENRDLPRVFIMIILWGGLNYANIKLIMDNWESLGEKLQGTYDLLNGNSSEGKQRNVTKAFEEMLPGKANYIKGIGVSFLTKILYFFDRMNQCLIFDKWGRLEHCAIMLSEKEDYCKFYKLTKKKFSINSVKLKGVEESSLYNDYLIRMESISQKIGVPTDVLEEYLFGYPLHKRVYHNPRFFLTNFLFDTNSFTDLSKKPKRQSEYIKGNIPKRWRNDKIIEWEWISLNGISTLLFIGVDSQHRYYCEINCCDRSDINIDTLPDAKKIYEEFNSYEWKAKNKHYKYVKKEINECTARVIKNKISAFVKK